MLRTDVHIDHSYGKPKRLKINTIPIGMLTLGVLLPPSYHVETWGLLDVGQLGPAPRYDYSWCFVTTFLTSGNLGTTGCWAAMSCTQVCLLLMFCYHLSTMWKPRSCTQVFLFLVFCYHLPTTWKPGDS